jgi:uncharacterized protein YjcR
MRFLNGIEEPKHEQKASELWAMLPEKVDENLLSAIDKRIELMHRNYHLYIRRNRILSAIAILETELKEIEDEIKRV